MAIHQFCRSQFHFDHNLFQTLSIVYLCLFILITFVFQKVHLFELCYLTHLSSSQSSEIYRTIEKNNRTLKTDSVRNIWKSMFSGRSLSIYLFFIMQIQLLRNFNNGSTKLLFLFRNKQITICHNGNFQSHDQKESNLNSSIITNSGAQISADRKIRKKYIQ